MAEGMVEISESALKSLMDSEKMLLALQNAGVDNWSGYDFAMELYREED